MGKCGVSHHKLAEAFKDFVRDVEPKLKHAWLLHMELQSESKPRATPSRVAGNTGTKCVTAQTLPDSRHGPHLVSEVRANRLQDGCLHNGRLLLKGPTAVEVAIRSGPIGQIGDVDPDVEVRTHNRGACTQGTHSGV